MTVIIDKTSDFGVLNTTTSSESVNKIQVQINKIVLTILSESLAR